MQHVGKRDRRVVVEIKTTTRNGVGDAVETWGEERSLWSRRYEGSQVAELYGANQTYATVTTVFDVGYFPAYRDIRPDTHRIVFKGQTFNILGAVEIGRQEAVQLLCVARGEQ